MHLSETLLLRFAQDEDPSGMRRLLGPDATAYTDTLIATFDLPKDTEPQRLTLIEAFWRTLISDKFLKMMNIHTSYLLEQIDEDLRIML